MKHTFALTLAIVAASSALAQWPLYAPAAYVQPSFQQRLYFGGPNVGAGYAQGMGYGGGMMGIAPWAGSMYYTPPISSNYTYNFGYTPYYGYAPVVTTDVMASRAADMLFSVNDIGLATMGMAINVNVQAPPAAPAAEKLGPPNTATITLHVAEKAVVMIQGKETKQTGVKRTFITPELTGPGTYDIKVNWTAADGKAVEHKATINVAPGARPVLRVMG